jgi:dihydrofolate synthase/folylpolyglutamate synthase
MTAGASASDAYRAAVAAIEARAISAKSIFTLDRTRQLLELLGNPQNRYPIIHITGTAGKGSTSHLTASILTAAGYRVGLHTSPHLVSMTESLLVDGIPVSERDFVSLYDRMKPALSEVSRTNPAGEASYFEMLVAMSLLYFADRKVDAAVVEVGLGGRFDATNVVSSAVSVVTNIGLDHTEFLGDTIEKIAGEKREIIKPRTVTVSGATQPSVRTQIEEKCAEVGTKLYLADRDFAVANARQTVDLSGEPWHIGSTFDYVSPSRTMRGLRLALPGLFQCGNAATAITAATLLPGLTVPEPAIKSALATAAYSGRFEIVAYRGRHLIIDGAHNPMKMGAFVSSLKAAFPDRKLPVVLAVKNGKDLTDMLSVLVPAASEFFITSFPLISGIQGSSMYPVAELKRAIGAVSPDIPITAVDDPAAAVHAALSATPTDPVVVTGSLYFVGKVYETMDIPFRP